MTGTRYLADTHVLLWALALDERLRPQHRDVLAAGQGVLVSIASLWEIAIKSGLGKLRMPPGLVEIIQASAIGFLPISVEHALHVATLPGHHGDPFDRMLVAQAQVEGLTVLTMDRNITRYDVAVL